MEVDVGTVLLMFATGQGRIIVSRLEGRGQWVNGGLLDSTKY